MDWNDLLNLHRNPNKRELLHLLKEVNSADDFCPTATAFANSKGGSILIGVDFNNFHLRGANDVDEQWIIKSIEEKCQPSIAINLESVYRSNHKILIVHVSEGGQKPYTYNRSCYLRENGKTRLATMHEEQDFLQAAQRNASHHPVTSHVQTDFQASHISNKPHPLSTLNLADIASPEKQKAPFPPIVTEAPIDTTVNDTIQPYVELESEIALEVQTEQTYETETETQKNASLPSNEDEMYIESEITNKIDAASDDNSQPVFDPTSVAKTYFLNRRQKRALTYLKHHDDIKNKKYRTMYKVSHKTAHIELADMVEKGILRVEGSGRSTSYVITLGNEHNAPQPAQIKPKKINTEKAQSSGNRDYDRSENIFEDDEINAEILESSLLELKNLMGEVEEAAENPIEYPTGQNSFDDRRTFLMTYLKSNNMITDHHYAELLNISISVAQDDLGKMENRKMVKKIVNLGQIYYLLEAGSLSNNQKDDSEPPRILALPY
ncbi:MAG: putative DNA binding domain-containing protein [bacterium]|nr:putative DNA binding domain-containing protein [bacterium]